MTKFLTTAGISYHLQELINKANDKLVLISPYLKFNERVKQSLEDKNKLKIDIRVVFGKNELQAEEDSWLKSMENIRVSFCKNLHAKCYLNENVAIITSMNLYEFSEVNNHEMGIFIEKSVAPELYREIYEEVQRLLRISNDKIDSVEKTKLKKEQSERIVAVKNGEKRLNSKQNGYCIRTGVEMVFNVERPLSYEAFKEWNKYANVDYAEKYCHFSGEESRGQTSVGKPILRKNWKKAKEVHGL
jgi:phosphatidylserine/phosphatidylglycerophosphate/cardiolipin synthase-like enzyme